MNNLLTVSPSPHIFDKNSVPRLMFGVIFALLPAFVVSIYNFGWGAIIVTSISISSCLLFEFLIQKYLLKQKPTITDGSAIVTGLLLAFNMPCNLPVSLIILGALVSIGIGKMTFGGLGNNPFNPALVGRVFLLISFPVQMNTWPLPKGFNTSYYDALTGATPLAIIKDGVRDGEKISKLMDQIPSYSDMFLGQMNGSMGEIAGLAIILGFIYLLWKRIIRIHIPLSIILTIVIFTGALWLSDPEKYADPLFHLLSGGILLGAIFMATDYVTSPMTSKGMWIYGIGIGIITVLIRVFGVYPEGISFAILIMNAFVPIINEYLPPKRFGKGVKSG